MSIAQGNNATTVVKGAARGLDPASIVSDKEVWGAKDGAVTAADGQWRCLDGGGKGAPARG
jgi:hypothetical protein